MTIVKVMSMTATADKLVNPNMKKTIITMSLFFMLAGVMLTSCASDKTATESTTTTRQTTVTQPSATQTTTQTTRY